jgi:Ca-activated chloride channel family protein
MSAVDLLISQFHFLRPWWLVALAPVLVVALLLWYQKHNARSWQQMVAPELLQYLLDGQTTRIRPWQLIALLLAWIISCLALAGPSWEKRPVAVEQNQQALVLLLDLSPSMMSEDVKPSRLVRARLKIADLLRLRKDGQTALLVYAGDVHVVTPLTDDTETINNIIPALHPNIMPAQGSNTEEAVSHAIQLLKNAAITQGDLLLITDGIDKDAQYNISEIMTRESQYRLSILGVGGTAPTPIPSSKGGFVRDNKRNIVTTQLNVNELQNLASQSRGRYRTLASTSSDIDYLMDLPTPKKEETQRVDRDFDSWYDRGHWLVLLLCLFIVPLTALTPNKSYAFGWDDLWKNKNQQAYEKLQQEQAAEAAQQFDHPDWKASAQYRAGDYEEAAKNFAQSDNADAHYNRGNALAKANKLPDAIKAYDQALKLNPELEDAKKNRKLVEELLKQQQQNQDQQDKDKDEQDQKDQDQQKQDQGNSDQQKDEQQQDQQQQDKNDQQKQQDQNNQQDQNQQQNQSDQQSQQDQQSSAGQNEQQKQSEQEKSDQEQSQQEKTDEEKAAEAAQREQEEQQAAEEKMQQMQAGEPKDDGLTDEERQAMEQWLRRIPDDPGGLLRNKFNYEHYKRNQEILNGDWEPAENGAEDRW